MSNKNSNTDQDELTLPIKRTTGETLEERLTANAYHNILPARYLKKDTDGNLTETQEDLFKRIGRNVALAEAVYELERQNKTFVINPTAIKPNHHARGRLAAEVFGYDTDKFDAVEDVPKNFEEARQYLETDQTELTTENVNKVSYDTIVPQLPDDIQSHVEHIANQYVDMHENLKFIANSPTLMNAGDDLQQLSACFVDSPEDDMDDIHETAKEAAKVFQSGGGMGYAFWRLRPKGDPVGSSGGVSSGPITFMNTYDQMCETVAQGGTRRGAQMGIMRVSHPDVLQFIHAKNKDVSLAHTLRLNDPDDYTHNSFIDALEEARELIDNQGRVPKHLRNAVEGHLSNFNISVGITDDFMEAVQNDEEYTFTNPRTGEPHITTEQTEELYEMFGYGEYVEVGEELSVPAREIWDDIIDGAHENGEPGVIYLERANKKHSFDTDKHPDHQILATNPCVAEGTLVNTPTGYKKVENISVGDEISTVIGSEPVNEIETHTEKEVKRVKFSDGSYLDVTEDHMFNLLDGKEVVDNIRLKDVEEGDTVRLEPAPIEVEGTEDEYEKYLKKGILIGDGCYTEKTLNTNNVVKIAGNTDETIYNQNIKTLFGEDYFRSDETGSNGKSMNMILKSGSEIVNKFSLTPRKSHEKDFDVTDIDSKEAAMGLLDGLLASDGNINLNSTHPQIRWDTASYELAQSIREALFLLGIHGRISISSKANRGGEIDDRKISANYDKHTVNVSGASAGKYAELSRVDELHPKKGNQMLELQTDWVTTGNTWKAQIESIEDVDESETVYDLYCEKSDTWITSGYVSRGCGEQPLEEYEACNLGHINFSTLVDSNPEFQDYRTFESEHGEEFDSEEETVEAFLEQALDWEEFNYRIEYGTRFLEDVVTMSDFPIEKIEDKVSSMRKIGLGIMGYAQMLVQLGIQYGSNPANEVARQMMTHMNHRSKEVSHRLATSDEKGMDRGVFSEWDKSKYANPDEYQEWFEHHTGEDASDWSDEGFPLRNHNTSTIAPTGCVAEDTLVSTTDGLETIDSIEAEDAVPYGQWSATDGEVTAVTDTGKESVDGVYDNSLAEVKTIQTEQGFSVSATPNHRFRVINSDGEYVWREAGDFEVGDNIVMVRNTFTGGSPSEIDTSEIDVTHHNTDDGFRVPDVMTDELAEFLGYYMGDGYVHNRVGVKYVVDSSEPELEEYLIDLCEEVFGVTPTVEDRGSRKIYSAGGRHLPRIFEDNGWTKECGNNGEGSASAFIPEEILSSSESHVRSFLRGLFEADGCASRKVELSTVSEKLASQVQTALLSLGYVFVQDSIEGEDIEGHYGDRTRYTVRGANKHEDVLFGDEVGFITKEFDGELTNQSYKNDSYPPAVLESIEKLDGFDELPSKIKKRVQAASWNGSLSRRAVRDVEQALGEVVTIDGRVLTDLYVATVSSVEDEMAYTRDMEVPSTNTYTANGFVSHNTTSMVGNTTGGCEPMFNVAYMKNVSGDVQGDEMLVEFDDYFLRVLEANDVDIEPVKKEAQELMQANEFEGAQDLETVPDEIAELFITTSEISGLEHASVQCAFQDGVDSSISKTVNFPQEATKDDMREVYEYIYENGGKGVTVYRDGTRSKQVLTTRADNTEFSDSDEFTEAMKDQVEAGDLTVEEIISVLQEEFDVRVSTEDDGKLSVSEYRKRPDSLVGINQRVNTGYGTLYVWISEDENGDMFEVFASIGKAGGYTQSFTEALCRMISMALRYGVPPKRISNHLSGIQSPKVAWEDQEQVSSVADGIAKAIDDYLEYGGVVGLIMEMREGDSDVAERLAGSEPPQEVDVEQMRTDVTEAVNEGESVDLTDGPEQSSSDIQEMINDGEMPECPDCGGMNLYYSEGCKTCESCGWSEC